MARKAPPGQVYAVDVQPAMLAIMNKRITVENIEGVALGLGNQTSPDLPGNSTDLAAVVDVYHELPHPQEMMRGVLRALKPAGRSVRITGLPGREPFRTHQTVT